MDKRLCEGGIEIDDGPCRKCGRLPSDRCGRPQQDQRDAEIERLWEKVANLESINAALRGEG